MMDDVLSPEEYQQLLQLGAQNETEAQLMKQQLAQAASLRQGNMPEARMMGRVVVPPSIAQLLGGLAREGVAANIDRQTQRSTKDQGMRRQQQNALILRGLTQGQAPQGGGVGMLPPGAQAPGPRLGANMLPEDDNPYSFGAPRFSGGY